MNAAVQLPPEAISEADAAEKMLARASSYIVTSTADYEAAGAELRSIKERGKAVEAMRKKLKQPALDTCRAIDEFFNGPKQLLSDAETALKRALNVYDDKLRREREEAERRAAEAQRKERERLEREAAKAEAAARAKREAEEAKARKLEEEGRAAEAEARRRFADEAEAAKRREAEEKRQAALMTPPAPVIHQEAPKVEGMSTRTVYKFEIVDAAAIPREFLIPDEKAIGGVVRAMKDRANIPGVRVYAEHTKAMRTV